MKRRRKVKKTKRRTSRKRNINFKAVISSLLTGVFLLYTTYFFVVLFGIQTKNPIEDNLASHTLLSRRRNDLEKTLFIFEGNTDEDRRISDVYAFFENRSKNLSLLVYIPGRIYFGGLEGEFGSPIAISSLRYAGDFLQEGRGVDYTLWQLSDILGFRPDNYIWLSTEAYENMLEIYGYQVPPKEKDRALYNTLVGAEPSDSFFGLHNFSSNVSNFKTFLSIRKVGKLDEQICSNMSFIQVLQRLGNFNRRVERSQTYALDISRPTFSTEKFSDVGGVVRDINIPEYDRVLRRYLSEMIDRGLEQERVRVEVYNATNIGGRALIYSRKIQNAGCDVVRFGNAPGNYERTKVYVSDKEEFKNSLRVVSDVLLDRFEILEERPSFMTTGDIVIILGEDISQMEIF
jgi:hypothetical protein